MSDSDGKRINPRRLYRMLLEERAERLKIEQRLDRIERQLSDDEWGVKKGPGGKWFVHHDGTRLADMRGHDTPEEAYEAMAELEGITEDLRAE